MVSYLFPGWVNAGENGGSKLVKNPLFRGSMLVVIYNAIWIVSDPRSEHIRAVNWLNESALANFYLLKIEAIQIEDSHPAPWFTLIAGPSEEIRVMSETKKNISARHILRMKWWTDLLERAKSKTQLHANISPTDDSWVGKTAGINGLQYVYIVGTHSARVELFINSPNGQSETKRIFNVLHNNIKSIEQSYGGPLIWQNLPTNKTSRIADNVAQIGYLDAENKWPSAQDNVIDAMVRLYNALSPCINKL